MAPRTRSLLLVSMLVMAGPVSAASLAPERGYDAVARLASAEESVRRRAAAELRGAGDRRFVAPLVDSLFFVPRRLRAEALATLAALAGEDAGGEYHGWVELVGRRADLGTPPGYLAWKGRLLARIDPDYATLLRSGVPLRIRAEEIVWGGVPLDGIPALDHPAFEPAAAATYLEDGERVFGVAAGGERRAYPLRILSWHEMVNDRLGGEPIVVSYCTLCASGVVYSARAAGGGVHSFGTSGLLYRSNKLMFDRATSTLWSNLTGEPVLGPLARDPVALTLLPVALTTWGEWRRRHPETTVLSLTPERARRHGFDYRPGAADRARAGVSFPIWQKSRTLPPGEEVFGLRRGPAAKAYPVTALLRHGVFNDLFAGDPVVLVAEAESGSVRAYARGAHRFTSGPRPGTLADESGRLWTLSEEALLPPPAPGLEPLPRQPAHHSYWSAWYGFFPHTAVLSPD